MPAPVLLWVDKVIDLFLLRLHAEGDVRAVQLEQPVADHNRPGDGQVGVLVALVRASVLFGTMPKQKLLDVCSPNSLGDGKQDMAIKTLCVPKESDNVKIEKFLSMFSNMIKEMKKME